MSINPTGTNDLPVAMRPPFLVRRRTTFTWIIPLVLLAVDLYLHPRGGAGAWVLGAALVVLGEVARFWAAGYISKDATIATGGPYAYVRNPLYFGSLLLTIGYGLVSGLGWIAVGILLVFYLLFHLSAIFYEEKFLRGKFGETYMEYYRQVPRLIPSPLPRTTGKGEYSWAQAVRNREPVSALFALGFTILLSLRLLPHH